MRRQRGECIESDGSSGVCFLFLISLFFLYIFDLDDEERTMEGKMRRFCFCEVCSKLTRILNLGV
jgi:hypothetical protein